MCETNDRQISQAWDNLLPNQTFTTPDAQKGVDFSLDRVENYQMTISPQNITISKAAFIAAVRYLRANGHDQHNPCQIRSSNDPASAGPLCLAVRQANNAIRWINYILPILANIGSSELIPDVPIKHGCYKGRMPNNSRQRMA
jgi:hypothetical protein